MTASDTPEPLPLRCARVDAWDAVGGLVHGFERSAGVAPGESRAASRARVTRALAPFGELLLLRQVHGARVHVAPWASAEPEGDASLCEQSGWLLGIETADCLPLLIVDPRRGAVAAAHAGWRGTLAGVGAAAVAALVGRGSRAGDLLAALGPAIGACCYEVGDELRTAFMDAVGPAAAAFFRPGPRGRPHFDLRAANVAQLARVGLDPHNLHQVDECTRCRADLYPSFRRDGPAAGRLLSFVGFAREGSQAARFR